MSMWTPACFINIQMLTVPFFLKSMVLWKYLLPAFILPDLIQRIKDKGGLISFITLHVASTEMLSNRKIQTKCVEEVTINEEYYEVPQATADIINTAKQNGGRIFAVGTTVTRCLESAYSREHNCLKASSGWTALYIHPVINLKWLTAC